ncbi:MAG: hypothetical protein IK123_05315, partial [Lachnospiraceae bacterium]|nr:hypothetical protein [Lachnospiraceae bacterium]
FDHMLEGFTRHGLFDLDFQVKGDLEVDAHHTIEDSGIVLGRAIKEAVDTFDFNTADELVGMLKEYRLPKDEEDRYERISGMITRLERDAILEELNNG